MSPFQADLLIKTYEDNPVAIIEVYNALNLSKEKATVIRGDMIESGLPLSVPYFLLLSQDEGYLWRNSDQPDPDAPPLYHFPMTRVVQQYAIYDQDKRRLYNEELDLLVLDWLINLIGKKQGITEEPEKTLVQTGFNKAIEHTIVLIGEEV
jgi:hypothetical protein